MRPKGFYGRKNKKKPLKKKLSESTLLAGVFSLERKHVQVFRYSLLNAKFSESLIDSPSPPEVKLVSFVCPMLVVMP